MTRPTRATATARGRRQRADLAFAHLEATVRGATDAFLSGRLTGPEHYQLCREALDRYVAAVHTPLVHTGGTDAATQEDPD